MVFHGILWDDYLEGNLLHNYGQIPPCIIGKSTIHGSFSIAMLNYQRIYLVDGGMAMVQTLDD